ncbi:MAG: anaerobic glycerol-3-phosphate dehydrogenase subunit B [Desulfovibrio sp.]|jgi:glycerol-3-phosphate dehydrogenase subunit B|nr:anaerobic glycerol-3-phosphate dehydrogenase subunit B [Desulfovibrio sp.]
MRPTDVLVVGSGMAGLIAAITAASRGKSVRLAARGAGHLAVGNGCVDVLGYVDGEIVRGNPVDSISRLSGDHPYRRIGAETVAESLAFFARLCAENGFDLAGGNGENQWIPTALGSFKPTWFYTPAMNRETLSMADRIVITHMPWLKDCHADMVKACLARQRRLMSKDMYIEETAPFRAHRNLTPLAAARFVDTEAGERWLLSQLSQCLQRSSSGRRTAVLLPPILGVTRSAEIRARLSEALDADLIEMASPPPGVGGLRIRRTLLRAAAGVGVTVMENAHVVEARVQGQRCVSLVCDATGGEREVKADSFIIATGGFLNGGLVAAPGGKVCEAIFGHALPAPERTEDWTMPDMLDSQPYAKLGVQTNTRLNPITPEGDALPDNVYFAGRTLAGYDFVNEKSGMGVAIATGYHAGMNC